MLIISRQLEGEVVIQAPDGQVLRIIVADLVAGRQGGRGYVRLGFEMPQEYVVLKGNR